MKRKFFSIAGIWIALILLVFAYTDRNEYTWSYWGEEAAAFVQTPEQAAAVEQRAARIMDGERKHAADNDAHGLWRDSGAYGEADTYMKAQDENGLNLMWGRYEAEIFYVTPEEGRARIVAPGRQSFVTDGGEAILAASDETDSAKCFFTLTDATQGIRLAAGLPEGGEIRGVVIHKTGAGIFSADLTAYASLAGIVLTLLFLLSCDRTEAGRLNRRDAFILVCAALMASMPSLWRGVYEGHDLFFHLNRIEGIASALRCGQFPVRIHASTILGYGYASSEFYPELFLYLPAILRNLGVSLSAVIRVMRVSVNLAAAASCYLCARSLYDSRKIAVGASVLYTLCVYRLVNLYVRATLGESFAMIFFPVLILALYEVLVRDRKRWPLLALSMTGIFMSHLLSTLFAAGFCVLAALLCVKNLLREPKRILACLLAAAVTALCSLWFLVPFLDYTRAGISTSVVLEPAEFTLTAGSMLVGFSGNMAGLGEDLEDFAYTIGVIPGLALMLGCALLAMRLYMNGNREIQTENKRRDRLSLSLLAFGALALVVSTDAFPWRFVSGLPRPYSTFFMQMQFPWRLVGIAAPLLSMAGAWGYLADEKHAPAGMALLLALSVMMGGYTLQCFVQQGQAFGKEDFVDTRIEQYEYTYLGTTKSALEAGRVVFSGGEASLLAYDKHGTDLNATIAAPEGVKYVELPLLYYPGYHAELDGEARTVRRGTNNVIRVFTSARPEGSQLHIWYEEPALWRIAEAASLAGFALLAMLLLRGARRKA